MKVTLMRPKEEGSIPVLPFARIQNVCVLAGGGSHAQTHDKEEGGGKYCARMQYRSVEAETQTEPTT